MFLYHFSASQQGNALTGKRKFAEPKNQALKDFIHKHKHTWGHSETTHKILSWDLGIKPIF